MELPIFNKEQPGCTYYYSPLSVYNLGVVNHAHEYQNGVIKEHMYAHVYHEGVAKKGANNVASLILKTLRQLNLLRDNSVGGELNIVFDNCAGQNKNNTVLKMAAWIQQMGFFRTVNFVFLIVGHTKNAADRLFNSLKTEYRKQNIFTMQGMIHTLSASDSVTVVPSDVEDFWDYDALFSKIYRDLSGQVKNNHIFTCSGNGSFRSVMDLRESNLDDHKKRKHEVTKKNRTFASVVELREYSGTALMPLKSQGMNPYKRVEMWKKYRPVIPFEYWDDDLYAKPDESVMAKVVDEKLIRAETRAVLKTRKYGEEMRDSLENIAFGDIADGDKEG